MTEPGRCPVNSLIGWDRPVIEPLEHGQSRELQAIYSAAIEPIITPEVTLGEVTQRKVAMGLVVDAWPSVLAGAVTEELSESQIPSTWASALPAVSFRRDIVKRHLDKVQPPYGDFDLTSSVLTAMDADADLPDNAFRWLHHGDAHPTFSIVEGDELSTEMLALVAAQSVLVMRLSEPSLSGLTTKNYLEYSAVEREDLDEKSFRDIDTAYDFVKRAASEPRTSRALYRSYAAGLLSILQAPSVFPDIYDAFVEQRQADFVNQIAAVTRALPHAGIIGPYAINGVVFDKGVVTPNEGARFGFEIASDVREVWEGLLDVAKQQVHATQENERLSYQHLLYGGRFPLRFVPNTLPYNSSDTTPYSGRLAASSGVPGKCPALFNIGDTNLVITMANVLYEQAHGLIRSGLGEQSGQIIRIFDASSIEPARLKQLVHLGEQALAKYQSRTAVLATPPNSSDELKR